MIPLILVIAVLWTSGPLFADDFFIHFRIAKNGINGFGPYFNSDEPVLASSAPLYTLLVGIIASTFHESWPVGIMLVQTAAIIGVWIQLKCILPLATQPFDRAVISGVVLVLLLNSAIAGMETTIFVALVLYPLSRSVSISVSSLLVATMAIGFRPEGILFLSLCLGALILRRPSLVLYQMLPSATLMLGSSFLLWRQYGTLIPTSLTAKNLVYDLSSTQSLISLDHHLRFWSDAPFLHLGVLVLIASILLSYALLLHNFRLYRTVPYQIALLTVSFSSLLCLMYVSLGVFIFFWYAPLIYIPTTIGLTFSCTLEKRLRVIRGCGRFILLSFLFLLVREAASFPLPEYHQRELEHRRVVKMLEWSSRIQKCLPSALIAAPEIGALGAIFRGALRDGVGIASPSALHHHPLEVGTARDAGAIGALPRAAVDDWNPDVIIALPIFLENGLVEALATRYYVISTPLFAPSDGRGLSSPPDLWGQHSVTALIRKEKINACILSNVEKSTNTEVLYSLANDPSWPP